MRVAAGGEGERITGLRSSRAVMAAGSGAGLARGRRSGEEKGWPSDLDPTVRRRRVAWSFLDRPMRIGRWRGGEAGVERAGGGGWAKRAEARKKEWAEWG